MRKYIAVLSVILVGCTPALYKVNDAAEKTAYFKFKMEGDTASFGTTAYFETIDGNPKCGEAGNGKRLAVLDVGNPLIGNVNADGLKVEAEKDFGIAIRQISGKLLSISDCSIFFMFDVEPNREYTLVSISEPDGGKCAAAVFDSNNERVKLSSYGDCQH